MSEAADKRIEELEKELRGAHEMLFLVLDEVAEPVVVPARTMRDRFSDNKMIDITMTDDKLFWVFSIKDVNNESV